MASKRKGGSRKKNANKKEYSEPNVQEQKKKELEKNEITENKNYEKKEILENNIKEDKENEEKINLEEKDKKENNNKSNDGENVEKETTSNTVKENEEKINNENKIIEQSKNKETQSNKKTLYSVIFILFFLIIISIFSTVFALLNMNSSNIAKGIKIKNIDVSGLTQQEAKTKIEQAVRVEFMQNLNIKYKDDFEINLDCEQIDFSYNIEKAISEAYKIGREGNIIKNNYTLLYAAFVGKNVSIDYNYNKEFLTAFMEDMESKMPGVVTQPTYYIEENELIVNKGIDGIGINKEELTKKILDNIYNRNAEMIIKNNNGQKIEIPIVSKKSDKIDIQKIYEEIYTEPKDAYYELEPFNIYPEVNGVDLEIGLEEAKKQIENEAKEEYRFKLKITVPEKTIKSFGVEAFPNLVGSFSTRYNPGDVNRSNNLEIAAGKINGLVLMPGEIFSFNTIVGKRTVEEGYRDAKIYQDGAVVDGLAGGICQISSTLYNAVLLANLEIIERRNHSFTTTYVPAGKDATVVYGRTDFQFKNSRTFPIKIEAAVNKGIATFKIHAVSLEDNEYEVKITPVITQSIPYTTEHVQDPSLAPGQQVVTQVGHAGYRVTTYKELIQGGIVISKDVLSNDVYKPMKAIVRIGP